MRDNRFVKRALVASLVLHVGFGGVLLSFELREGERVSESNAIAIEIVAPPVIAPPASAPPIDVQGGGASQTRAQPTTIAARGERRARRQERALDLARAQLADYAIDRGSTDGGQGGGIDRDGDGGEGRGTGGNRGDGIGFGDGRHVVLAEDLVLPPPPAEKRVSKARPAKLIYPTRERDLGEDRLFVAKVTVDTDGYVVGAKLVRGRSGPRDDEAADLIFRFRYLPALDDDGHAIKSTFEQPFHVNR
jgi:hypothetical protein